MPAIYEQPQKLSRVTPPECQPGAQWLLVPPLSLAPVLRDAFAPSPDL